MNKKRVRRSTAQVNVHLGDISAIGFNTRAGAAKSLKVGPEIRKKTNAGLGAIDASTLQKILPGTLLAIYNNTNTVQWLTMNRASDGAPTTPTGLANAFPLKPNDWTYLSMGENDQILTSSAQVGVYIIEDESLLFVATDDQY